MQEKTSTDRKQSTQGDIAIFHFSLPGLLPQGHVLALHREIRTLSLLYEGPVLLKQQQFSDTEYRVLTPILEAHPHSCLYEVVLANLTTPTVTAATIERYHFLLQKARAQGTWHEELRPVRRALSSLRIKLHPFNLQISTIRERGYHLTSLKPALE